MVVFQKLCVFNVTEKGPFVTAVPIAQTGLQFHGLVTVDGDRSPCLLNEQFVLLRDIFAFPALTGRNQQRHHVLML